MEVRMREIVVLTETGVAIWDDCQLMHQPAVDAAKSASSAGLRCQIVVRHKEDASQIYYVKDDATMSYVPFWFEPKTPKLKKVREPLVGPKRPPGRPRAQEQSAAHKRPPGRPRIDRPETRLVSVQLTAADIAKVQAAGNGNLSAGIRKAIELLP